MEKKTRDDDASKGESSIAVNGFLLCKGRFNIKEISPFIDIIINNKDIITVSVNARTLFPVQNFRVQLRSAECPGT